MLGIDNYSPKWYRRTSHILEENESKLNSLIGKEIKEVWVVWELTENQWFRELPIVIKLEDCQLELCASKADEFSITFDQINLSKRIDYYGTDFDLKWEKNRLIELTSVVNRTIRQPEIIEYSYSSRENSSNDSKEKIVYGVGLKLDEGYLAVCNGFDENTIKVKRDLKRQYQYIKV